MSRFVSGDGEVVSMATFAPSSCTFSFLHIVCIGSLKQFWLACYILCLWRRFDRWREETERGGRKQAEKQEGDAGMENKCAQQHTSLYQFFPHL